MKFDRKWLLNVIRMSLTDVVTMAMVNAEKKLLLNVHSKSWIAFARIYLVSINTILRVNVDLYSIALIVECQIYFF